MKIAEPKQLFVKRGIKENLYIQVPNTECLLPVTVVHGEEPGKTVFILSGVQGDEFLGIRATSIISKELTCQNVKGKIVILHCVNGQGFFTGDKTVDDFQKEQIKKCIIEYFINDSDYYIEVHTGDCYARLQDQVLYPIDGSKECTKLSRKMAIDSGVGFMRGISVSETETLSSYALKRNMPSIRIEDGGGGQWKRKDAVILKKHIYAVLVGLHFINKRVVSQKPGNIVSAREYCSSHQGCFIPYVKTGSHVLQGELLGEVRNLFDETVESIRAKENGVVLYLYTYLPVNKGDCVVSLGKLD